MFPWGGTFCCNERDEKVTLEAGRVRCQLLGASVSRPSFFCGSPGEAVSIMVKTAASVV